MLVYAPAVSPSGEKRPLRDHVVQFYAADDFLTQEVAHYFEAGIRAGDACFIVATEPHRRALEDRLANDADRIVFLDAAEQLAEFDRGGIDPSLFERGIARQVERASAANPSGRVRAFGEMVTLLASSGRHADALELEGLWERLVQRLPLDLLCSYPLAVFNRAEHSEAFRAVCRAHTHVRPAEHPAVPDGAVSLDRCLAELQQQELALAHEGAERMRLEHRLSGLAAASASDLHGPGPSAGDEAHQRSSFRQVIPRRVLVVDDDPRMADAIARWLRSFGHAVQVASDGAAAIAEVVRARPEIVLLDIAMPKIDGYEVARRLRALPALHSCVLVALTGLTEPEDILRAQRAGFDHHLAKPPDLARLEALLRSGL
jgi:CheY-like chemotaxis protein